MSDNICAILMDDKDFARSMGRRVLQSVGVSDILEAANGHQAWDLIRREGVSVDVVFCDLMMPDMDGIQFFRHLSTLPAAPSIVIVSSADKNLISIAELTARARGLNVLGSISKPMTPDTVTEILAEVLGGAAAKDSGRKAITSDVSKEGLQTAIADQQLQLHFQPKVSCDYGLLDGFEALVRWYHPVKGMISPVIFIAAAEENCVIGELTEYTTKLAIQHCAEWRYNGLYTKVSVNLSAFMLTDLDFPELLEDEVKRAGIDAEQLILEITESGLFQETANTLEILARLHMKGFTLSIDDFGTGYSSMAQLSQVPFREMKIDKAFVRGAGSNSRAQAILKSSVELARRLNMKIVAEGVETESDWELLRNAGVDFIQGYVVAKPMPGKDVLTWASEMANSG